MSSGSQDKHKEFGLLSLYKELGDNKLASQRIEIEHTSFSRDTRSIFDEVKLVKEENT